MPSRIRRCLAIIGFASIALAIGFALATPFLPLPPFWQQLGVGFVMIGLQMTIWLGPVMTSRISHIRQEMSIRRTGARPLPSAQKGVSL